MVGSCGFYTLGRGVGRGGDGFTLFHFMVPSYGRCWAHLFRAKKGVTTLNRTWIIPCFFKQILLFCEIEKRHFQFIEFSHKTKTIFGTASYQDKISLSLPSSTTSFPSPSVLIARPIPPLSLSFDPTKERERFNVIRPPSHKRRNPHLAKGPLLLPSPPQQLNRFRPRENQRSRIRP